MPSLNYSSTSDCAFAIALTGPDGLKLSAAAGTLKSDTPGKDEPITVDSKFAWGSCKHTFTLIFFFLSP